MIEWQEVKLWDVCKVIGGGTPSTKNCDFWNGNIPWLTPKDLSGYNNRYITKGERNITQEGLKNSSARILPKGSVLLTSRAPIGYVAIAKNDLCTNQGFKSLVLKEGYYPEFFYYLLKNNIEYIIGMGSGSTFAEISGTQVKNLEFTIPPLDIQQKIAEVLGALDDKIELNNKINNNLEQQAQALFDEHFPSVSTGEINIGKYISPKRGKNLLSKDAVSGKVPVVAGGLSPSTYHNTANTTSPVITISASGANAGYVHLWHIPVWSSDSSFIDSKMTPYVYFWFIMLKKRQKEIFDSQTGSAQPHIYPQHIEVMPISELDMERVKKYNNEITPMFNLIGRNIEENTQLAQLRDTLLPKLMSGEIDVSKVNISADKLSFNEE
ncbi:MAG: restriction endonuclease subunit S [Rickettsiales bacterium]|nr:restriction endonuclease subunit S [Rickettsiales bacterium]